MALIILNIKDPVICSKMAAFDYDWTLVKPKAGKTFPSNVDDWQWLYPTVPIKLKQYHENGYTIIIFTNQSKAWKTDQIRRVVESLEIPIIIVIANDKSKYKPNPVLFNLINSDNIIDKSESFFVGDALGRKTDFSDTDRLFAENIGVKWMSPEQMFCDIKLSKQAELSEQPEVIIMMGYPGSGKSTIAKKICENPDYIYIEGDIHKKSSKMIKVAQEYAKIGKSIIFDATNGSKKKRQEYVEFAKTNGYNCIKCIYVATDLDEAYGRNMLRQEDKRVPRVAYSVYKKGFEEPTEDEGFRLQVL